MKYSPFILTSIGITLCFLGIGCSGTAKQASQKPPAIQTTDGHNSQSSLDWKGSYRGVLPCADCEGIETVIHLNENNTFYFSQKYLGKEAKPINASGSFTWTKDGNKIMLDKANDNRMLQVGENQLFWLDNDGNRITGSLASHYWLEKMQNTGIMEKYWKLVRLGDKPVTTTGNREAHIILKQDNNRLIGNGGCNALTGSYTLAPMDKIRFTGISSTEMACDALKTEQELIKVLQTVDSYLLKGDTLLLYKGRMAPLARFEAVYLR